MKQKEIKKAGVRIGTITGLTIIFVVMMLTLPKPIITNDDTGWHVIWDGNTAQAAENNPGAGASGFLEIFLLNHTASPATAYNENTSATMEGWATTAGLSYASADSFYEEISHSVTFDIVVRVRFNKTHCWDGSQFIGSRTRVNITCSGDITIADSTGTNVESYNNSGQNYIWINVYWNNAGAGYSINADESFDVDEISIEAKY